MVTQAAVTCSVFDTVVSNAMQMMESVQFHDFNRSTVKSAMISPDFLSVPGSYAGSQSSFISLAVPTKTERCSSEIFLLDNHNICLESQCRVASLGTIYSYLKDSSRFFPTFHTDLSACEYDAETLVEPPPASSMRASV